MKKVEAPVTAGDMIRIRRREMRLSTAKLGKMIGVTESCISKWETGKRRIDIGMVQQLADVLQMDAVEILKKMI